MFRTQFLVKKDYFWRVLDFNFFYAKFVYETELNYNKFCQGRIDRPYSLLTLLDEINSLLHVALHSATVTNCSKDQFMNPLLLLYM